MRCRGRNQDSLHKAMYLDQDVKTLLRKTWNNSLKTHMGLKLIHKLTTILFHTSLGFSEPAAGSGDHEVELRVHSILIANNSSRHQSFHILRAPSNGFSQSKRWFSIRLFVYGLRLKDKRSMPRGIYLC